MNIELGLFNFTIYLLLYTYRISDVAMFMWFNYRCRCGHCYCYTLKLFSTQSTHPNTITNPHTTNPTVHTQKNVLLMDMRCLQQTQMRARLRLRAKEIYLGISTIQRALTRSQRRHGSSLIYEKKHSGSQTSNASIAC